MQTQSVPIVSPSESTISVSTRSASIPYEDKAQKKWLPWKWFKKNTKKTLNDAGIDRDETGTESPSIFSQNESVESETRQLPSSQLVSPPHARALDEEEEEPTVPDTMSRLTSLRELMTTEKVNIYIVPSYDTHISEFVASKDRRLKWISGFTGCSGLAVITQTEAALFTDSRYWLQASNQLGSNWKLQRVVSNNESEWFDYIQAQSNDSRIGIDPRHVSHKVAINLRERLRLTNSKLVFPERNLIDAIWIGRPHRSKDVVFIHPVQFSGLPASDKLNIVRDWIRHSSRHEDKPNVALLASLSEIAWTLNLRGKDVPFNPVFYSYLLITLDSAVLFIEAAKVTEDVAQYLSELGVKTEEYDTIWNFVRNKKWGDGKVLMSENVPYVLSLLVGSLRCVIAPSIVEDFEAVKNNTELRGLEQAYVRDGAVFVRWLAWFEERMRKGPMTTEYEAAMRLFEFQKQGEHFEGLAYETRSAYGPNAAMPFYTPRKLGSSPIDRHLPYLIDSGCQFFDGTCSTTRTLHFGQPTNEQREAFTRVLQGHIAIDSAIFPEGTTGGQLDTLAKRELWAGGLNYLQPTGHGIGSFLSVHEGPQAIALGNNIPLKPGHVLINQPGFYLQDNFGIRIGSALAVTKIQLNSLNPTEGEITWLGFRRLTRVPIQTRMLQASLLSEKETSWIKEHNLNCFKVLAPLLKDDRRTLIWLREQLEPSVARALPKK